MRRILTTLAFLFIPAGVVLVLVFTGNARLNFPSSRRFPIRGIDVSHHQGRIDWAEVGNANVSFAFIKATEGSSHCDSRFRANWNGAHRAGIARSAYHFFGFCSSGEAQARKFIATVPRTDGMLPPVVDVEFSGMCSDPPGIQIVRRRLRTLLLRLEEHYGCKPIIYVSAKAHEEFIAGHFPGYPLWVRDVFGTPDLAKDDAWTFWQYACTGRVPGIKGFVDLNVFVGDSTAWRTMVRSVHSP